MAKVPTVLVTGASGYIATHIVQQLLQAGEYQVRGTVRSLKNEQKVAPIRNLCPNPKYPLELVEADLSNEECWLNAVKGCKYVLHTASPFPAENPKNDDEVIKPAVNGTLFILKACRAAGGVARVVLTSSVAAVSGGYEVGGHYSEKNFFDAKSGTTYVRSKALAEKAAWDFMKELPDSEKFELAVLNPAGVTGPVLSGPISTTQKIPLMLLERQMPMVPKLNSTLVDVRDVAKAHIIAMTLPEAAGNRHILSTGNIWFVEIAKIYKEEFQSQGYNVPTTQSPNFLIKLAGLFDSNSRALTPSLDKVTTFETERFTKVLGITPIPVKKSLIDMAYSMIEAGKIKKASGYKGPISK